jgi:hypothetical protein
VIANAIELSGCDLDPAALNEALFDVEFDGLSGHIKFDQHGGHQSVPNVVAARIENGQLVEP